MQHSSKDIKATVLLSLGLLVAPVAAAQDTLTVEGTSVGVGVQNEKPSTTLHVRETDDSKANRTLVRLSGSDFYPQFEYENESSGNIWRLGINSKNHFVFDEVSDSPVELRISPDGRIFAKGDNKHADYVFDSDYKLMPMEDLRSYVREHKHLPNVLSSKERADQGGIDLASFPVQLLEKIEELTLYTIKQHEQIQKLSEKNRQLTGRLEALEGRTR